MRRFSDQEREQIREELVETGRERLLTYGPAKTTVKDITDPVGIAKPTFYQFFDAKADLYLEIYQREFDEFVESLHTDLAEGEGPRDRLERLFRCYTEFAEENEFIQRVFLSGDYRESIGTISEEKRKRIEQKQIEAMLPPIKTVQRQTDGPVADMEPFAVLGLMGATLGLLVAHRDEVERDAEWEGETTGFYYHIRDTLITVLARGLTVQD